MKKLKFKCELLTDVILNTKSASEGNNTTLEFIPGNVFLGIVASTVYKERGECDLTTELFHNGRVRFGDAHPEINGKRSYKIPALFFQDKVEKAEVYLHHRLNNLDTLKNNGIQLKQCRTGFYTFEDGLMKQCRTEKSFAIKSAHDMRNLTSKDECMFGYESLRKGMVFHFSVEIDNESLEDVVKKALIGKRYVGRSRTAQYGQVKISYCPFDDSVRRFTDGNLTTVYADGRLIFIDENTGMPTFQPNVCDLGLKNGKIRWDLTQIRTFQYSPWNFKRQTYDFDRCGIEKGSVFVVENAEGIPETDQYVGCFRNEGFGKVIYNPYFLEYCFDENENGISKYSFEKQVNEKDKDESVFEGDTSTGLLKYITAKYNENKTNEAIYEAVNKYVDKHKNSFLSDGAFASQWGHIRTLAMQYHNEDELYERLFSDVKDREGYLLHGVALNKWSDRRRMENLRKECDRVRTEGLPLYLYLVNLSSQMQKVFRNKK